jgi:predicted unusual protein kinase regulating ubiquinone biosynthesis (AarF/ABC1/UbiB family)
MSNKTHMDILKQRVSDIEKDYEKAKKRNVKAAATRVRKQVQMLQPTLRFIREEMRLVLAKPPTPKQILASKKATLRNRKERLQAELISVQQQLTTLETK